MSLGTTFTSKLRRCPSYCSNSDDLLSSLSFLYKITKNHSLFQILINDFLIEDITITSHIRWKVFHVFLIIPHLNIRIVEQTYPWTVVRLLDLTVLSYFLTIPVENQSTIPPYFILILVLVGRTEFKSHPNNIVIFVGWTNIQNLVLCDELTGGDFEPYTDFMTNGNGKKVIIGANTNSNGGLISEFRVGFLDRGKGLELHIVWTFDYRPSKYDGGMSKAATQNGFLFYPGYGYFLNDLW